MEVKQELIPKLQTSQVSSTPQTAISYRNSMYHRGRWYTINNEETSKRGQATETTRTTMDLKERCNKCLNSFPNRAMMLEHNCVKAETCRNYTCAYCDRTCSNLNELGKHMEDHVNERPYRCGYCSCSFNNGAALNQHVRIHSRAEFVAKTSVVTHGIDKPRV